MEANGAYVVDGYCYFHPNCCTFPEPVWASAEAVNALGARGGIVFCDGCSQPINELHFANLIEGLSGGEG